MIKYGLIYLSSLIAFVPTTVLAAEDISLRKLIGTKPEDINFNTIGNAVIILTNWAIGFAGVVALGYILFGAIQYITSGGNQSHAEAGKNTLTWAIVGLVVVILAYALIGYFADIVIK